jgi:hypothetical protein
LITNAEAAILFQQRRKESLCFTGCGWTTHELVTAPRLARAKVRKSLILLAAAGRSRRLAGSRHWVRGWRNVLRIGAAEAANPPHRGHALLAGDEAAIVSRIANIISRAPRIILRLCARVYSDCHGENRQYEKQNSHGGLPVLQWCSITNAEPTILLQK